MTAIIIVAAVLLFVAVIFAIHNGYGVKTAMRWLGLSLTFEAQKPDGTASNSKSGQPL
jgi:hypothetical protein